VIDVLVVQEEDDPLYCRADHGRRRRRTKKSPAGAGEPGRRGRLRTVYSADAAAQVHRRRTAVTMPRRPMIGLIGQASSEPMPDGARGATFLSSVRNVN
jgi:hypothetical protein